MWSRGDWGKRVNGVERLRAKKKPLCEARQIYDE